MRSQAILSDFRVKKKKIVVDLLDIASFFFFAFFSPGQE